MAVHDNIRAEMARRGLTSGQAAAKLGISRQAVCRKLRGQSRMYLTDFLDFAEFLDMDPMDLLADPTPSRKGA